MEDILKTHTRLTESELSKYWGIKRNTLQKWRSLGIGPIYIKLGAKVIYPREAIIAYEQERMFSGSGKKAKIKLEAHNEK
ncbi:MAG: helix-turn-helix domain-containing protein [Alphaproteobacteria bacterium]|nr:helix-turn-helix domain-containing protein [Alphaproteobacteria bacterium]